MIRAEPTIRIQQDDFSIEVEMAAIREKGTDAGAVVSFTGLCRGEGDRLSALEIEHYPGMAEAEATRIAQEAIRRWDLLGATVVHRHGEIKVSENIVLVITASRHRHAAFEAAEFLMDWLKSFAPFWKREHHTDGSIGAWVEARDSDDLAARSWDRDRDSPERQAQSGEALPKSLEELTCGQNEDGRARHGSHVE